LNQKFVDGAGHRDVEGALITSIGAPANVNPDFLKKFNDKFKKDPMLYAPESYDAVNVFLDAIGAGKQDRKGILGFVETYDQPGITKQIKFDPTGEVTGEAVYSYEVKDGKINWTGVVP
jgi:branched-chain amino acid transport system substrate-binding protein